MTLPLQNLQPLDAYLEGTARVWRRMAWVVGVPFGTIMALMTAWWVRPAMSIGSTFVLSVLVGYGAGAVFGLLWSRSMARSASRMTEALFNGAAPFDVEPPPGDYRYRLPGSLRTSEWFAVGGVLFLGPGVMTFIPHSGNLPAHRQPVTLITGGDCQVQLVPQKTSAGRALIFGAVPDLVQVASRDQRLNFLVPRPAETATKIRSIVAA